MEKDVLRFTYLKSENLYMYMIWILYRGKPPKCLSYLRIKFSSPFELRVLEPNASVHMWPQCVMMSPEGPVKIRVVLYMQLDCLVVCCLEQLFKRAIVLYVYGVGLVSCKLSTSHHNELHVLKPKCFLIYKTRTQIYIYDSNYTIFHLVIVIILESLG